MNKQFKISMRGSTYYFLNALNEDQILKLQQFARQFYVSNPSYSNENDDTVVEYFFAQVKQTFGIVLNRVNITAVLVIK